MVISVDRAGSVAGLEGIVRKTLEEGGVRGLLIMACDENGFSAEELDPLLTRLEVPAFGGIFPSILVEKEKLDRGCVVVGIRQEVKVELIHHLSDENVDYEGILENAIPDISSMKTMLVLVDGFSKRISAFIDSLFNMFGLEINYVGGGAGSMSMKQKPCLITNHGLVQDSALLAMLRLHSGVGVCHGWQSISGPYKVTESDRNIIRSLDWQPAFQLYRRVVEEHSGMVFNDDNFFHISKAFPFGIAKMGAERVVRDPFMLGEDDSLICVGEVPPGSFVDILKGDTTSLVAAAGRAASLGRQAYPSEADKKLFLFMDCISRVLFLGDGFADELNAVHDPSIPLIGACTIGEIANSGNDYLEFYNKTSVLAVLENP